MPIIVPLNPPAAGARPGTGPNAIPQAPQADAFSGFEVPQRGQTRIPTHYTKQDPGKGETTGPEFLHETSRSGVFGRPPRSEPPPNVARSLAVSHGRR